MNLPDITDRTPRQQAIWLAIDNLQQASQFLRYKPQPEGLERALAHTEVATQALIAAQLLTDPEPESDRRPHSRACGWRQHDHGTDCHSNCPTCHGQPIGEAEPADPAPAACGYRWPLDEPNEEDRTAGRTHACGSPPGHPMEHRCGCGALCPP